MTIPVRESLRLEILNRLFDGNEHTQKEILNYLAIEKFHLSDAERKHKMSDGKKNVFDNRARWAFMDLKKAGLLEKIDRPEATFKITKSGLEVLNRNLTTLDTNFLSSFPGYRNWKKQLDIVPKDFKKKIKKIDYTKGIIVLLDSLGTKGKWKAKQKPDKISQSWHNLLDAFQNSVNIEFGIKNPNVKFLTFSDTIMIIVKTNDIDSVLPKLASSLRVPFVMSMATKNPIRGCITTGSFHLDKTFIVGPAIEEAANYYELPQWVGISASPSANREIDKINNYNPNKIKDNFFKCDIPLRESIEQNAWVLKWTEEDSDDLISRSGSKKKYKDTLDFMNGQLENANSIDGALKWRNTIKFYELITSSSD